MGRMRLGYGSEFHLLRWMGRHRDALNRRVAEVLGEPSECVRWLDFQTVKNPKPDRVGHREHDQEWLGLDMLADSRALQEEWAEFWPTGAGIHNWDAVGWVGDELLLVEAKAHTGEIKSDCGATSRRSVDKILRAFREVQVALGVALSRDWTREYYQFTNRLAALYFLHKQGVPAHLLFIYFTGDKPPKGVKDCPATDEGWRAALSEQARYVGLLPDHVLSGHIHKLFLPVSVP